MTLSSDKAKIKHFTNMAVSIYTFDFKVFKADEISVTVADKGESGRNVILILGVDYTVSGLGLDSGGRVTLTDSGKAKAGNNKYLVIMRSMPFVQETDYRPHDLFPAETHERCLDIAVMERQELREALSRAIKVPIGSSETPEDLWLKFWEAYQEILKAYLNLINSGQIYTLPPATKIKLGGVKVGDGLSVKSDGLLAVNYGPGLGLDENGQIAVDFTKMPTDKFEAMLRSIRVPIWLSKKTTWYVDGATGNDLNDGSSPAKAFKTIQKAVNYVSENFNLGTYQAIIHIADGIYPETVRLPKYNASIGSIQITGESQTNTIISGGVMANTAGLGEYNLSFLSVRYNGQKNFGSSYYSCIRVLEGMTLTLENVSCDAGNDESANYSRQCLSANGGAFRITNNCIFTGGACSRIWMADGGNIYLINDTQINGQVSAAALVAQNMGSFATFPSLNGGVNPVISGSVVGRQYSIIGNSVVNTNGGGSNYFPGHIYGIINTGGQYS